MRPKHKQAAAFLAKTPLFGSLSEEEIQETARRVTEVSRVRGAVLSVASKTRIDRILVVRTGALERFTEFNGRKMLSGRMEKGEVFGGVSILMGGGVALGQVQAASDATFYALSKPWFLELCSRHPEFYGYFAEAYSRRVLDETFADRLAMDRTVDFLSRHVPFSFLPETELKSLAPAVQTFYFPKDTVLLVQDRSPVEWLYIIEKGAVERYDEKTRREAVNDLLGEADVFGGITLLLNQGVSPRTVKALEDTFCYGLAKQTFLEVCKRHDAFSEFFTDAFGKRMLDRSYAELFTRRIHPKDETPPFFNQPLETLLSGDPVTCDGGMSIQAAAGEMTRHGCSSILIRDLDGTLTGMVTDNDLRRKVTAVGYDIHRPVREVMSSPLTTANRSALVFEGLMTMMHENIKHLAIADGRGRIVGVLTNQDLLRAQGQSPLFLIRRVYTATSMEQIQGASEQVPRLIQGMIAGGAKADNLTRLITAISDAVLAKIIRFSVDEAGPPPCAFAFMILGSEGRKEQTLKTDQDNAIVFEDVPEPDLERVGAYFLALGDRICTRLDRSGYAFCTGGVMAKNPKWCRPLTTWQGYFSDWIHAASPESLLHSSIFFDFRHAWGDRGLVDRLHGHLLASLEGWEGFFRHMTENALQFTPPLGFFRNFVMASKGEHRNKLDIKGAMMPIVDIARIYALKHRITETNTLERLRLLRLEGVLTRKEHHDLEQAYGFMMQLRFVRQVTAIVEQGVQPDNHVDPRQLSGIEQKMLKEIFKRIEIYQAKLEFDFAGTIGSAG